MMCSVDFMIYKLILTVMSLLLLTVLTGVNCSK